MPKPIKNLQILLLLSLIFSGFAYAQNTQIKGKIIDDGGLGLEGVKVTVGDFYTLTLKDGTYSLVIDKGEGLTAFFTSYGYKPDTTVFSIKGGQTKYLNKALVLMPNFLNNVEVIDKKARFENQIGIKSKDIEVFVGPGSDVEGIIKTLPGVSSYNELSSQYSVRGGNFDENLVYVNGIELYRPFLVRNGQQEGLSFINSQMVQNVKFSAGGFEARYGDKMSSVLDITYRTPKEFGITAEATFMGGNLVYEDVFINKKLSVMLGSRYRTNQLLLGTLDTEADFRPRFTDVQAYLTYHLTDEWDISFLGNYSSNKYQVIPETRTTDFGTFQEALRVEVFFDGMEDYDFTTRFGAFSTAYTPNKDLQLKFTASAFQTTEQEYFDVEGAYRLGELNNNLGSDDFGEISFVRGVGGFQNYARNNLDAIVASIGHDGIHDKNNVTWRWGLKYQFEDIIDQYKEWERIDSAGYSIPHNPSNVFNYYGSVDNGGIIYTDTIIRVYKPDGSLDLFESYDSKAAIQSSRIMAYVERTQLFEKNGNDFYLNVGLRTNYWTFNKQNVVSPRASFSWKPDWEKDMVWRIATGLYYQPPFYREMRELNGGINKNIKAQESVHYVLGNDYQLKIWNRPFKMVTELYYKGFNQLIPYSLDNVRIRYTAQNNAKGYAYGLDYRINGEFVKGVDSWFSLSLLKIEEDIAGDGAGYLPRPTDQRFNAKVFFQDYLPKDPTFRMSLTLSYGTGIPFGPPQAEAKDRNYRLKDYFRTDIGFSKVLKAEGKTYKSSFLNQFKSLWVGLEVFNLLDRNNTISYLWIKDASAANEIAVPNYLTGRLLNLKLVAKF